MNGIAAYTEQQPNYTDDIIERHAPLVKRIACHLINRLPACVQLEDMVRDETGHSAETERILRDWPL